MEGEEENTKNEEDEAPAEEPEPLAEEPEPPPEEPEPPPEEPEPPPEEPEPEEPEPPPDEPPKEEPLDEPSPSEEPFEYLANALSKPIEAKSLSQSPTIQDSSIKDEFAKSEIIEPDKTGDSDTTGGFKATSKSTNDVENVPRNVYSKKTTGLSGEGGGGVVIPGFGNFSCSTFLTKRSPFIHNPPHPEERRERVRNPRTPREYIINLREDLADFQETHGLPRTRDYSFMSLGLALAQETARAFCSLVLMFAELFPILAIVSLIMRFALDKLIEILETDEPVPKLKKSVIFALQLLVIIVPLWILIGTIIIPLISLILSIFKRIIRFKGAGKRCSGKAKFKPKAKPSPSIDLSRLFY